MNTDKIEKIYHPKYNIYIIDFKGLDEDNILELFKKSTELAHKDNRTYGTIYCTEGGVATPKIRQLGKKLSIDSEKTGLYIGSVVYGVNTFIKMVAKLSNKKVQFGKNKEDCIKILHEMFLRKRPNHLP